MIKFIIITTAAFAHFTFAICASAKEFSSTPASGFDDCVLSIEDGTRFAGAVTLSLPEERGGISGMESIPGTNRVLAVTDRREWLEFTPEIKEGTLVGVSETKFQRTNIPEKFEPESMVIRDGFLYLGCEKNPAVISWPILEGKIDPNADPTVWDPPVSMKKELLKPNGNFGLEAMAASSKGLYAWKDTSLHYSNPIPMWELEGDPLQASGTGYTPAHSIKEDGKDVLFRNAIRVTGATSLEDEIFLLERTYFKRKNETKARISKLVKQNDRFECKPVLVIRALHGSKIQNLEAITIVVHDKIKYALVATDDCEGTRQTGEPILMLFQIQGD